ncbi:MAG: hypothetical protein HY274_05225, partial [Gammaproteobacteria bacterium]|nr:hypothetical protein [Gammaproteobacteria bacterium]
AVTLSNATVLTPTFTPTATGTYVFTLTATDGHAAGVSSASVTITADSPPVANAGSDQPGRVNELVSLNGSASSDPDSNAITYRWSSISAPTQTLSDVTAVSPTFVPNATGSQVFRLVVNDGLLDSAPSDVTVTVAVANRAPVVSVGADRLTTTNVLVTLSGSATDADNDPVTYSWSRTGGTGPQVTLNSTTVPTPTFTPTAGGTYAFTLTALDGHGGSGNASVTITANTPPVANAGSNATANMNSVVHLSGSGTDSDGDPLTYSWARAGGTGPFVVLSDAASPTPSFTPTVAGTYIFTLTVTDARNGSGSASVTITAVNRPPIANAGPNQTVLINQTVQLDGSGSADPDGATITYSWTQPTGPVQAGLSSATAASPTFSTNVTGTYGFALVVNDGMVDSAPATVNVTVKPPGFSVDRISPTSGPSATIVSLTGQSLDQVATVSFGGRLATTFVIQSPTDITANVPAQGANGPTNVTISKADGQTSTSVGLFNYTGNVLASAIPEKSEAGMAYDSSRQRVVVFGSSNGPSDDTWEWDGVSWAKRLPATSPPSRHFHTLSQTSLPGHLLLFDGVLFGPLQSNSDTWEWDGTTWTQRTPATPPPLRTAHVIVYDSGRGKVVLFGGADTSGGYLNDTWEWNGLDWTAKPSAPTPPTRGYHAMAYDAARADVLLFGGHGGSGATLGDLWTWNGTAWTQFLVSPMPPGRESHCLAYDEARRRVVLFGGKDRTGTYLNDTWEWDGSAWTQSFPSFYPSPRAGCAMTYDVTRRRIVLLGGFVLPGPTYYNETWEWDGANWSLRAPDLPAPTIDTVTPSSGPSATTVSIAGTNFTNITTVSIGSIVSPSWTVVDASHINANVPAQTSAGLKDAKVKSGPKEGLLASGYSYTGTVLAADVPGHYKHRLAYDSSRSRVVLFSGQYSGAAISLQNDTWEWDDSHWAILNPVTRPPGRESASFAQSTVAGQLLLFGGLGNMGVLGDTWLWNGSVWSQLSPAPAPSARFYHATAYDAARNQVVLFGGNDNSSNLNDTWLWNGSNWSLQSPTTSPPRRYDHALAYDSQRNELVLFGGFQTGTGQLGDTWTWNGSNWSNRTPASSPPAREASALAFDKSRGVMVLFGGDAGGPILNDTWEWDGTLWAQRATTVAPPARSVHAMSYHEGRKRIVVFGGWAATGGSMGDTWDWDGTRWIKR